MYSSTNSFSGVPGDRDSAVATMTVEHNIMLTLITLSATLISVVVVGMVAFIIVNGRRRKRSNKEISCLCKYYYYCYYYYYYFIIIIIISNVIANVQLVLCFIKCHVLGICRAPIKCGSIIRLTHLNTNRNLHSHHFQSPLSRNLEVSAFGDSGTGDEGKCVFLL